ncbi:polyadenylate-binding protein, cytoplasmic and nuclear-like [Cornus florida]|uniref:polyadenylate-binding protein, cytoplasmic and nuclear-like n=1 Tax=Cornus florida TaxID=4283 RepID=UPI00289F7DA0|nr:polyadenylate-binding protein, cytoplasmic and nuclear-like [Cornus florida]
MGISTSFFVFGQFCSKYVNERLKKRNSKRKFVDRHNELSVCSYVYVKNLNESIDDLKLFQLFSDCEGIMSAKVIYSTRGKSRGFGFVGFCSHEAAKEVCYGGEILRMGRESLKIVQTFQFGPLNLGTNDEGDDEEDPPDDLLKAGMIGREGQNDIQEGLSVYVLDGDEPDLVDTQEMLGCNTYDEFARRLHASWAKVLNEEPLEIVHLCR